jgi:hypothetical protein
MDASLASWLVIAVAIAFANLPFLNERVFGFIPMKPALGRAHAKYFVVRLLELIVLYFVVGALARMLETQIGNAFTQTWEFYAITACLFVVLAFPGFVGRYLYKRKTARHA